MPFMKNTEIKMAIVYVHYVCSQNILTEYHRSETVDMYAGVIESHIALTPLSIWCSSLCQHVSEPFKAMC